MQQKKLESGFSGVMRNNPLYSGQLMQLQVGLAVLGMVDL